LGENLFLVLLIVTSSYSGVEAFGNPGAVQLFADQMLYPISLKRLFCAWMQRRKMPALVWWGHKGLLAHSFRGPKGGDEVG
jgi:hypothetical protein